MSFKRWMLGWAVLVVAVWAACLAKYLGDMIEMHEEERRLREENSK